MKLIIQNTGFRLITVNNINATLLLLIIKYPKTRPSNPTKAMKRNNASGGGGSELTVTDKETTINNIEEDTLKTPIKYPQKNDLHSGSCSWNLLLSLLAYKKTPRIADIIIIISRFPGNIIFSYNLLHI
jgi:hypothetical protein